MDTSLIKANTGAVVLAAVLCRLCLQCQQNGMLKPEYYPCCKKRMENKEKVQVHSK